MEQFRKIFESSSDTRFTACLNSRTGFPSGLFDWKYLCHAVLLAVKRMSRRVHTPIHNLSDQRPRQYFIHLFDLFSALFLFTGSQTQCIKPGKGTLKLIIYFPLVALVVLISKGGKDAVGG